MLSVFALTAFGLAPSLVANPRGLVHQPRAGAPLAVAAPHGRRAALLGALAAMPALAARADSIEDIAKRNAEAAEAAKSPEALAKIAEEEKANENSALYASAAISVLLFGSTAISMAPVSENVKRVGKKVRTGVGRKY
jgi:hypothetical protein